MDIKKQNKQRLEEMLVFAQKHGVSHTAGPFLRDFDEGDDWFAEIGSMDIGSLSIHIDGYAPMIWVEKPLLGSVNSRTFMEAFIEEFPNVWYYKDRYGATGEGLADKSWFEKQFAEIDEAVSKAEDAGVEVDPAGPTPRTCDGCGDWMQYIGRGPRKHSCHFIKCETAAGLRYEEMAHGRYY